MGRQHFRNSQYKQPGFVGFDAVEKVMLIYDIVNKNKWTTPAFLADKFKVSVQYIWKWTGWMANKGIISIIWVNGHRIYRRADHKLTDVRLEVERLFQEEIDAYKKEIEAKKLEKDNFK